MTGSTCPRSVDAAAFALGALTDAEAEDYAGHVQGCRTCQHEVAELQLMADTLPMAAPQVGPPPELKDRIMAVVHAEAELLRAAGPEADRPARAPQGRSSRLAELAGALRGRRPAVVAAACCLLAAGVVVGTTLDGGDGRDVRTVAAQGPGGADVTVVVGDDDRAELVMRDMPAAPAGRVYQVWLAREGGDPQPTRTLFTVPADGRARVAVDEPVKGVDQVLVTAEPAGGSRQPTRDPVVVAKLA